MEPDPRPVIELDQFLKRIGAVGTGGQAKVAIQGGDVHVNGVVETRRRRKLQTGDLIQFQGSQWVVGDP